MEKKEKMIIGGLIVVIIALIAVLAVMFLGNNLSLGGESTPPEMQVYDFNSEFKMAVPNSVKFLKEWNNTGDMIFGQGYTYFDKNNEILVAYVNSPLITHELINSMLEVGNSSGNASIEYEGDLIVVHSLNSNGKMGKTAEKSNFTYSILLEKGHEVVGVSGNDLDLIKSMIKTVEFYE